LIKDREAGGLGNGEKTIYREHDQFAEKAIFLRLLKNVPAFAEAATRRQADARRPQRFSPAGQAGNPEE
jgi:hypothetical protein